MLEINDKDLNMNFGPAPIGVDRNYNYDSDEEYSPVKRGIQVDYSGPGTEYREPPANNYALVLQT